MSSITRFQAVIFASLLFLALNGASGVERFPPPEFEHHALPVPTVPAPRGVFLEYTDVAVLVAALGAASYLALTRRSRRSLALLGVFSLVYFGFWRKGCICPIGAIQDVTLAFADPSYAVPVSVIAFFLLPLAFTLFFGRTFCAAVCPLGAMQDIVVLKPLPVPTWLENALRLLAVVYLGLAVLFTAAGGIFMICRYDPFVALFRISGATSVLIFGACFLLLGVFIARPYCRFLCPYGVILGWLSHFSRRHVTITPDECIHCRLCEDVCPFGAIRAPSGNALGLDRKAGKVALVISLALLPILAGGGAWLGSRLAPALSRSVRSVQLAQQVWREDARLAEAPTPASVDFRARGQAESELYADARRIQRRFAFGGGWCGGFVGLVFGAQCVAITLRRKRVDYEPDRFKCVSCGRCFSYCPRERLRLKRLGQEKA